MSNVSARISRWIHTIQEKLIRTFRRKRSIGAATTTTARAALSALSSLYSGYAGGDEEAIALVVGTDQPFGFDLEMLMKNAEIEAMVVLILGKINSRKTTLAKNLLFVRLRTSFGGRQSRAIVEDVIVRNGIPEWQKTAEKLRCTPVPMHEPFNPISSVYGMSRDEHMMTVEDLITAGGHKRPIGIFDHASRIAFLKMYSEYPEYASIPTFARTLEKLSVDDVLAYGKQIEAEYKARIDAEAAAKGEQIPEKLLELMQRNSNIDPEKIVKAALKVLFDLNKVLEGHLGRMFGGTKTIEKGFKQRLVVLDYTKLLTNPDSIALVKRFVRRLLESAKNRNDLDFMFQTDISDEAYKMLRIGDEAIATSDDIKSIRSTDKAKIILSQRPRDFLSIGDGDTSKRNASNNLFGDVSVFFIGRQGKKDIQLLRESIEITEEEELIISGQGRGQFLVKIGDNLGIPIDTNAMFTDILAEISDSNSALDEGLDRSTFREDTFIEE